MSDSSENKETVIIRSCRICLDSQSKGYIALVAGNRWLRRFEYCFNLTMKDEDQPRRVCNKCAVKLKQFCKFKTKWQTSQELWKYITIVKCHVDRIQLKEFKDLQYTLHNEPSDSVEDLDSFSNCNSGSNNPTHREMKNDNPENIKFEIDLLKNECTDFVSEENEDTLSYNNMKPKAKITCPRCSKNYTTNTWYERHMELCKGDEQSSLSCKYINNNLCVVPDKFISHKNIMTRQSLEHLCGICKFSTTSFEDFNKHLDEHWINHDLQCLLCKFIAKDQAGLSAHRYNHYKTKAFRYQCHICQKKSKSQLSLQFHYRKDHLNKPGGLCSQPNCNKVYNCWRLWKKHEKIHLHPGYICDICGQKYKYKHLIVAHLMNHTNPSTHVCDVCGKTFRQMRNLKDHINNVHQAAKPVKCSHCNRVFKNQFHLRVHVRRLAREKTLKCEFCPMEYSMLSQLNSHLKSHSEERSYCCHICGSRYKAKSQLVIHMRNHTGDRPYKCVLCVKAFTSGTQLKVHTMSHTGILPFKCLHCDKAFRSKKRMLGHCAVEHKAIEMIN